MFLTSILAATPLLSIAYASTFYNGADTENAFITPPPNGGADDALVDNPEFEVGDTISVEFKTSWEYVKMGIFQGMRNESGMPDLHLEPYYSTIGDSGESWPWFVSLNYSYLEPSIVFDLANGNYFGLVVTNGSGSGDFFYSRPFNISDPSVGSTSSTAPTTESTQSGAPVAATDQASSPQSPGGISQSTKIGLGAGLGVGLGCVLIGLGAFLLWRRRRQDSRGKGVYQSSSFERTGDLHCIEEQPATKS